MQKIKAFDIGPLLQAKKCSGFQLHFAQIEHKNIE